MNARILARPWQAIDHLMLRVAQAEPLFDALAQDLGLPVVWPLQCAGFATYGWIGIGNTALEVWAAADNGDLPPDTTLPLVHGFALAPSRLDADLSTLRARGLRHRAPRTFASPDAEGVSRPNFTNAVVEALSSPGCCVFYCDWAPGAPIVPWPRDATVAERHTGHNTAALNGRHGGTLGITGLRGITLQSPDPIAAGHAWRRATGATQGSIWLADGVQLDIVAGRRHQITALSLGVRDESTARAWLAAKRWLGGGAHPVDHPALAGLDLRLVPQST